MSTNLKKLFLPAVIMIIVSSGCKKDPPVYDELVESTSTLNVNFSNEVGVIASQVIVKKPLTISPVFLNSNGSRYLRVGGTGVAAGLNGNIDAGFSCEMPMPAQISVGTVSNTPTENCGIYVPNGFRAGTLRVTWPNNEKVWLGLLKGSCGNTVDGYSKIVITKTYSKNYQWGKVYYADGNFEAYFLGNMNDAIISGNFTGAELF